MSAKGLDVLQVVESVRSLLLDNVDFGKKSLLLSLASIAFNPTAWNIVARNGEFMLLVANLSQQNRWDHSRVILASGMLIP